MQKLKQLFTLGFVIYFLGISLGFSLNLHYCNGEVADVALFGYDTTCGMHKSQPCELNVNQDAGHSCHCYNISSCCSDLSVYLHFESLPIISQHSFDIIPFEFQQYFSIALPSEEQIEETSLTNFRGNEKPPSFPPPYISYNQRLVYA